MSQYQQSRLLGQPAAVTYHSPVKIGTAAVLPLEPIGKLRGFIEVAAAGVVSGWAQDGDSPEEPVALELSVGGVPVLCVLANAYRADLRRAGLGSGCHGFAAVLPDDVPGQVEVRRVADRKALPWLAASTPGRWAA